MSSEAAAVLYWIRRAGRPPELARSLGSITQSIFTNGLCQNGRPNYEWVFVGANDERREELVENDGQKPCRYFL